MELSVTLSDVTSERIRLADHSSSDAEIFPAQPARTKNQPQDDRITVKDRKSYVSPETLGHDTVTVTHEGPSGAGSWQASLFIQPSTTRAEGTLT
jgi:hypothetical protein